MRPFPSRKHTNCRRMGFELLEPRAMLSVSLDLVSRRFTESETPIGESTPAAISADGRFVVFGSDAANVVDGADTTAEVRNIYRYDRVTGETILVSQGVGGTSGANGICFSARISADGDVVVFNSSATNLHSLDQDSRIDIFARRISTGTTELVTVNASGSSGAGHDSFYFDISVDGNAIAFSSESDSLHPLDHNQLPDVFVRQLDLQVTVLVSISVDGTASGNGSSYRPEISDDGTKVGFVSNADTLHGLDHNSHNDVYVRDLITGTTRPASVNSDHSALGTDASVEFSMSADGNRVAFMSYATNLSPLDSDNEGDIYVHSFDTGLTELVSVAANGLASADENCGRPLISGDGAVVAFVSKSTNLHPVSVYYQSNLYARHLASNSTSLVTVKFDNSGGAGFDNSDSLESFSVSHDGRLVAFQTESSGLHPLDLDPALDWSRNDVFVRDLWFQSTRMVSVNSSNTSNGNDGSYGGMISADGSIVMFSSRASNLASGDRNGMSDAFIRDLSTSITALVSHAAGEAPIGTANGESTLEPFGDSVETGPMVSGDGRYVVFVSNANNLAGEPYVENNEYRTNVYRYDRVTKDIILVSINGAGTGSGDRSSYQPVISADGNVVAFTSSATDLIAGQKAYYGYTQVYVRNIAEGVTVSASTRDGKSATGGSSFPAMSADGRKVVFESVNRSLSPLDKDSNVDIYVRDLATGDIELVTVNSLGTGSSNGWTFRPRISADGSTVAYTSQATNLHPLDTDQDADVFARRLGTHTTDLVSINVAGTRSGNRPSAGPTISADGNRIVFGSTSSDLHALDTSLFADLFLRDLNAGTTTLVSINEAGDGGANRDSTRGAVISADGKRVAFVSGATNLHPLGHASGAVVYVRDVMAGETTYVAPAHFHSDPALSADGNMLVFEADDLTINPLDTNSKSDVYVANLSTRQLQSVSRSQGDSSNANGDSWRPFISASGEYVLFYSDATDLHGRDVNGGSDVFLAQVTWDLPELSGDYNRDLVVDAADYSVWRDALGASGVMPYFGADGVGDGTVDQDDYLVWKSNFGRVAESGGRAADAGFRPQSFVESGTAGQASSGTQGARLRQGLELLGHGENFERTRNKPPAEPGAGGHARGSVRPRDLALLAWRNAALARWRRLVEASTIDVAQDVSSQGAREADGMFEALGLGALRLRTR